MRILHITDTHLGIRRHFRGAPAGWSRADDHLVSFKAALAYARDAILGRVDAVIHSGDLFDRSHPPADAVQAAIEAITETAREVPVYLMPGNHDRLGLLHQAGGGFGRIPGLTVTDHPLAVDILGARIGLVPFQREPLAWAAAASSLGDCDVLVAHQAFSGARVGRYRFLAGIDPETIGAHHLPQSAKTILCGHIHPRQSHTVRHARGHSVTVHYPGSTERTAFSERRETKGCGLLELGQAAVYQTIDLPARPMAEIHDEADAATAAPETLVRLAGAARTRDIEDYVLSRGAWVVPWKDDVAQRQIGLFG